MEAWVGCIAGALDEAVYRDKLALAGFDEITITATRIYGVEDARDFLAAEGMDVDALARDVDGVFVSAFVRASKPSSAA